MRTLQTDFYREMVIKSIIRGMLGGVISLLMLLTLFLPSFAFGQSSLEATWGQAVTLNFHLIATNGVDLKQDAVCATGDVVLMKDQGSEANSTNCFVDRGKGYSLALTAAEMTAAQTTIYIVDQTDPKAWLDKAIHVQLHTTAPSGTAQAGCTAPCATIQLATTASSVDDNYNNNFTVAIVAGTGSNQARCITDYTGSTRTVTAASNWVTAPDATSQYILLYTPNCSGALPSNAITSGVLDTTAVDELVDAVFGEVYESEGSITLQQFLKYAGAVLFGRSSGNGLVFKTPNNNATRVTATVDGNKNRTSVTLNP